MKRRILHRATSQGQNKHMITATVPTPKPTPTPSERKRALDILAKSLYRELSSQGYEQKDIVNLATALLGELTSKGDIQHS
jgi:hypothetical protein